MIWNSSSGFVGQDVILRDFLSSCYRISLVLAKSTETISFLSRMSPLGRAWRLSVAWLEAKTTALSLKAMRSNGMTSFHQRSHPWPMWSTTCGVQVPRQRLKPLIITVDHSSWRTNLTKVVSTRSAYPFSPASLWRLFLSVISLIMRSSQRWRPWLRKSEQSDHDYHIMIEVKR